MVQKKGLDVKNLLFAQLFLIHFAVDLALLLYLGYYDSFIFLNRFHSPIADLFFSRLTHLGDGVTFSCLIYLWIGKKEIPAFASFVGSLLITSAIIQIFKNLVFYEWERPLHILPQITHTVKGYEAYGLSFPSGHAAAIFSMVFSLMLWKEWRKIMQIFWLILAIAVSFSRIYLGVHFLGDVLAGTFIALIVNLLLFEKTKNYFEKFSLQNSKLSTILTYTSISLLIAMFVLRTILALKV